MFGYTKINTENRKEKYLLTIDGNTVDSRQYEMRILSKNDKICLTVGDADLFKKITLMNFQQFLETFNEVYTNLDIIFDESNKSFFLGYLSIYTKDCHVYCTLSLDYKNRKWNQSCSIESHQKEMIRLLESRLRFLKKIDNIESEGLSTLALYFTLNDFETPIESILAQYFSSFKSAYYDAIQNLKLENYSDYILVNFNFPDEIKEACTQYLRYFSRFLRDLGIDIIANPIEQETGNVLFSVTPKNQEDALEKIKAALEVYLQLPSNPNFNTIVPLGAEIAVQRLYSQIQHFQSQLTLARAEIQLKEATIQQQNNLLQQKDALISQQSSLIQFMKKDDDETEAVIEGVFSLKKFEGDWFNLELPEILRRLKKLIESQTSDS